jgi:predicted ester cyclase
MGKDRMLSLMVILCSGLVLSGETKPAATPQVMPSAPSQVLLASSEQRKPVAPVQQRPQFPGQVQRGAAEQNKAVARRVFDDLFTGGRYEAIDQIYAKDCVVHFGNRTRRLDEAVTEGKGWRSAAPDLVMTADQMSVDGDRVTVFWSARGTHTGRSGGLKPTGRRFSMRGRSVFRVVNGKIVEAWNDEYRDELFRQIGVNPKLGYLYDITQDFAVAVNRVFFSQQ